MQVSHVSDGVQNAIVGGMEAQQMGIADTPEFYHLLSASIYKYQMLAFIRETISNAKDAHEDAGVARPIEVTVDEQYYCLRDYGKGIPHKDVGTVYGTYGEGTKRKQKNQIGGFGLGCKSPLAYCDNFEITIWHGGKKTIYQMSKGAKALNGKPGIVPVLQLECEPEETGVQVRVPVQQDGDETRIEYLAREFIRSGDINAAINGNLVETINMGFDENSFAFLIGDNKINMQTSGRINIRYANVMYPLPAPDTVDEVYNKVAEEVNIQFNNVANLVDQNIQLIIQAPADSLSVHPSREVLTESEHTLDSLTHILNNWLGNFAQKYHKEVKKIQNDFFNNYSKLPMDKNGSVRGKLIGNASSVRLKEKIYTSPAELAKEVAIILKLTNSQRKALALTTLKRWKEVGLVHPRMYGIIRQLFKLPREHGVTLEYAPSHGGVYDATSGHNIKHVYTCKRVYKSGEVRNAIIDWYRPLLKKFVLAGLEPDRLFSVINGSIYPLGEHGLINSFYDLVPLSCKYVVLTTNKRSISDRLRTVLPDPSCGFNKGKIDGITIYHLRREDRKNAQLIENTINKAGFKVINMIDRLSCEPVPVKEVNGSVNGSRQPSLRVKAADSVVMLSSCLCAGHDGINLRKAALESAKRTKNPTSVIKISMSESSSPVYLPECTSAYSELLAHYFGDQIGLVSSEPMLKKWQKKGATTGHLELMVQKAEELWEEIKKSIYRALGSDIDTIKERCPELTVSQLSKFSPVTTLHEAAKIRCYLIACLTKGIVSLPNKDASTLNKFEELNCLADHIQRVLDKKRLGDSPNKQSLKERLEACKPDYTKVKFPKNVITFARKLAACPFLDVLDPEAMVTRIKVEGAEDQYVKLFINQVRKTHVKDQSN